MAFTGILRIVRSKVLNIYRIDNCFCCENNNVIKTSNLVLRRGYAKPVVEDPNVIPEKSAPLRPKVHKPLTSPEVTLILDDEPTRVTLEAAEKIARSRKLKLVKVLDFDSKSRKPLYKLMTSLAYFDEDIKSKKLRSKERATLIKEEKIITLSTKTGEHDVESKLKQTCKLLKKRHPVRVIIAHDSEVSKVNELGKILTERIVDFGTVKNTTKAGTNTKIFLQPTIIEEEESESDKDVPEGKKFFQRILKKKEESDLNNNISEEQN